MNRENDRDEELMFNEETTTIEYDEDSTLRINALAFALNYHGTILSGSAEEVVRTAQKFYEFLEAS